ncbi:MAG: CBS domain-containing protein [Deltaproteobacteria bacterium]|nr:CBS domain-containing protein [Deltaproteobacteria bacterium]
MTTHLFTTTPDASIRNAVDLMLAKRIGCLPVLEKGKLVGLLSESDCRRHLVRLFDLAETNDTPAEIPSGA